MIRTTHHVHRVVFRHDRGCPLERINYTGLGHARRESFEGIRWQVMYSAVLRIEGPDVPAATIRVQVTPRLGDSVGGAYDVAYRGGRGTVQPWKL